MNDAVLAAIITGAVSMAGTIFTVLAASRKTDESIRTNQAVMQTKVDELTREVREHNGFARRLPVVEEQIRVINHRLKDLEENDR